ncbi:hypothetical protein LIPSTDRAFT_201012 [Lipomyces starkeyi NRRL Y-11557]|uniref:Uncharacterized protein n=1 Tax=Lipomyces starkeyi NRRL Y-11557 TaxID=675824 RepID=A0A1E3PUZ8_LIPST|nr:hypothetical protein LIPSTDRAFT_201012 [Lipomyces starkeyi NRRL Y-11557]
MKQQSIATMFKKRSEEDIAKTLEQNLVRWMTTDHMAFRSIESQAFLRDLPGVSLPITSRRTMARRIDLEFNLRRAQGTNVRDICIVSGYFD